MALSMESGGNPLDVNVITFVDPGTEKQQTRGAGKSNHQPGGAPRCKF